MIPLPSHGLYAITRQAHPDLPGLLSEVRQALAGGAAVVQFRDKSGDARWRLEAASTIRDLCHAVGVPLIVNDDVELAKRAGADGVHIGRHDGDVAAVRAAVGAGLLLGVSCYNDLDRARAAVAAGADYLAFGRIYPSGTKPGAVSCGFEVLREARCLERSLVAIGGITPENGAPVIEAGADFLAAIGAVFSADDVADAARRFAALWSR